MPNRSAAIIVAVAAAGLSAFLYTQGHWKKMATVTEARHRAELLDQQARASQVEEEAAAATRRAAALEAELVFMARENAVHRRRAGELWHMVTEPPAPDTTEASTTPRPEPLGVEKLKALLAEFGGDMGAVVRDIMTEEAVNRLLEQHGDRPVAWTTAASFMTDPTAAIECLEEAAKRFPSSVDIRARLLEAKFAADRMDASTLADVETLKTLDPTNGAGDCYEAYCQFQEGNVEDALLALSAANAKGRFDEPRIGTLVSRYESLMDEGASDAAALGLAAFAMPLGHMSMLRQTGSLALEQAQALAAAGRHEEAMSIARDITGIGRTVSASGQFLIADRVGLALQEEGLQAQMAVYEAMGSPQDRDDTSALLQPVRQRTQTMQAMAAAFADVLAGMTEDDLAAYVDGVILEGEFNTLRQIPDVDAAIRQGE